MDLHSKMTMYITSKITSPLTKTAKTSNLLRLKRPEWFILVSGLMETLSSVSFLMNDKTFIWQVSWLAT